MANNYSLKNEFSIQGRVLSLSTSKSGKRFMTLLVTEVTDKPTFPHVRLDNNASVPDNVKVHDTVFVKGYVEGYDIRFTDGKMRHIQNLVATSVEAGKTELGNAFGDTGRVSERSKFRSYFEAELVRVMDIDENWAKIVVKTERSETVASVNYLVLSLNKKFCHYKFEKLVPGKLLHIYARISTPKKEINGKTQSFNNLVVQDITEV